MPLVIKNPSSFSSWLNKQNILPTERNRFITTLFGMVVGARLMLPTSLAENNSLTGSVARDQWALLHRGTVNALVSDLNELYPHDMYETQKIAELFWLVRYRVAAPRKIIYDNKLADSVENNDAKSINVLSAMFGIDDYFSTTEIFFMNKYSASLIAGFNVLNEVIVEE